MEYSCGSSFTYVSPRILSLQGTVSRDELVGVSRNRRFWIPFRYWSETDCLSLEANPIGRRGSRQMAAMWRLRRPENCIQNPNLTSLPGFALPATVIQVICRVRFIFVMRVQA